jgi:hypothetical protein
METKPLIGGERVVVTGWPDTSTVSTEPSNEARCKAISGDLVYRLPRARG